MSKSDPMCVIYHRPMNQKKWVELMRTEQIDNNLNPDFAAKLTMEYRFEQSQSLRFEVVDIDSPTARLEEAEFIGYLECTVANIVSAGGKGYIQDLQEIEPSGSKPGTIVLVAEELESLKDEVFLKFSGQSVGSCTTCFMVKSSFAISRINDAGNFLIVHRCHDTRGFNPMWPSLTIPGRNLCNGDKERQLKIEAYRKTLKQEDELIGFCFTSLSRLSNMMDDRMMLQTLNGQPCKTTISLLSCTITPVFTFLDYVQAGTKIHLCFAIDFTSSNGDPTQLASLHHLNADPKLTNPYEQAIEAAGQIVKDYDDTNVFPVYGFGARIPPKGETSHCFPITLTSNPTCMGIEGVLKAYRQCISRVQLFGPTNFSPIINRVMAMAENTKPGQHYYILVIVTDGVITDMAQTKEAIVKASKLPISIIIVGVGEAEFESMEELDGDDGPVSAGGKFAERDIVQFVEYRSSESWMRRTGESTANAGFGDPAPPAALGGMLGAVSNAKRELTNLMAQGQLAEEILSEVPGQVTGYMKARGIEPSSIVKEESTAAEVFSGASGPDPPPPEASSKKKKEKPEKTDKKNVNAWNVLSLVNKGKKKFREKSPRHRKGEEKDADKIAAQDTDQELFLNPQTHEETSKDGDPVDKQ